MCIGSRDNVLNDSKKIFKQRTLIGVSIFYETSV